MKTIMKFELFGLEESKNGVYVASGDFLVSKRKWTVNFDYVHLERDGKAYTRNEEKFRGGMFTEAETVSDVIYALCRGDTENIRLIEAAAPIQNLIDHYRNGECVVAGGHDVPLKTLYAHGTMSLLLATDRFSYYGIEGDDDYLMIESANGKVVSDNYFASEGLSNSLEAVRNGGETLLFHAYAIDPDTGEFAV